MCCYIRVYMCVFRRSRRRLLREYFQSRKSVRMIAVATLRQQQQDSITPDLTEPQGYMCGCVCVCVYSYVIQSFDTSGTDLRAYY